MTGYFTKKCFSEMVVVKAKLPQINDKRGPRVFRIQTARKFNKTFVLLNKLSEILILNLGSIIEWESQ